jgi:hypothetical protein
MLRFPQLLRCWDFLSFWDAEISSASEMLRFPQLLRCWDFFSFLNTEIMSASEMLKFPHLLKCWDSISFWNAEIYPAFNRLLKCWDLSSFQSASEMLRKPPSCVAPKTHHRLASLRRSRQIAKEVFIVEGRCFIGHLRKSWNQNCILSNVAGDLGTNSRDKLL